jgi:hypothetical protein
MTLESAQPRRALRRPPLTGSVPRCPTRPADCGNIDPNAMQSEELGRAARDQRSEPVVELIDLDVDGAHVPAQLSYGKS